MDFVKKNNVYYAITNYHILCCVLHSIKYHNEENNILYISSWHHDCMELCNNLRKLSFFSEVKIFEEVPFPSGNNKITLAQIKNDIENIINHIPKDFIKDINSAKNIYISGDDYCCSVYLVKNNIYYNYIEEACGLLSDEERLMRNVRKIDYSRYQIMKYLKLPGNNKFVINRYGDLDCQLENYYNEKDIHFSVNTILSSLTEKQLYEVVSVFTNERFSVPDNSILLLTFHYANMNILSLDEQRQLYSYLIDYFGYNKKIVIKQHPSDVQPNYKEWFPDALILPRKLPSELLPFLSKTKYYRILTTYSTSVFSMKKYCKDIISFDNNIHESFTCMDRYYFILNLIKKVITEEYDLFFVNCNNSIISNFLKSNSISCRKIHYCDKVDNVFNCDKKIIVLSQLNSIDFRILAKDDIVFFADGCKFKYDGIVPAFLVKTVKNDFGFNCISNLIEIFNFYSKNNVLLDILRNQKLRKNNVNCNYDIELLFDYSDAANLYNVEFNKVLRLSKNKLIDNKSKFDKAVSDAEQYKKKMECVLLDYNSVLEEANIYKNKYNSIINSSSWRLTSLYRKIGYFIKKIIRR